MFFATPSRKVRLVNTDARQQAAAIQAKWNKCVVCCVRMPRPCGGSRDRPSFSSRLPALRTTTAQGGDAGGAGRRVPSGALGCYAPPSRAPPPLPAARPHVAEPPAHCKVHVRGSAARQAVRRKGSTSTLRVPRCLGSAGMTCVCVCVCVLPRACVPWHGSGTLRSPAWTCFRWVKQTAAPVSALFPSQMGA